MALLDITTRGNPETVVIDGLEYHLTDFDDFSPLDQHKIAAAGRRTAELAAKFADLTDAEAGELDKIASDQFERIAGDIPVEVRERLLPGHKRRIVQAYFLAFAAAMQTANGETESSDGPQGSSPAFSGSTADDLQNG